MRLKQNIECDLQMPLYCWCPSGDKHKIRNITLLEPSDVQGTINKGKNLSNCLTYLICLFWKSYWMLCFLKCSVGTYGRLSPVYDVHVCKSQPLKGSTPLIETTIRNYNYTFTKQLSKFHLTHNNNYNAIWLQLQNNNYIEIPTIKLQYNNTITT